MGAKTPEQIAAIEEVQRATDSAFAELVQYLKNSDAPTSEGAHELLDRVLLREGCESPEGHIVAGGIQSAEPHEKGSGVLQPGEPIVIDIYPRSKTTGYFADMSRTVCIGAPSPELQKMYETVLRAQKLGISLVKPGARCGDIHEAVQQMFIDAGYETSGQGKEFPFAEGFVHGLGHGVGKEIHEAPRISRNSDDILEVGDVITIEPGLYYFNIGGVRLEDMVLVTEDGCRNLTYSPKVLSLTHAGGESAGGIVKGPDGRIVLVCQHGNSWSFPKGHVEVGESPRNAALREIEEETGITDAEYVKDLGSYERYSIGSDGRGENTAWGLQKKTFFLYTTKQHVLHPRDPDGEITEVRYVTVDEAHELLTHPKDKEFLQSVQSALEL